MLDLRFVVENAELVQRNADRKKAPADVAAIVALDGKRRDAIHQAEALQKTANGLNKGLGPVIGMLKKAGGGAPDDATREKAVGLLNKALDAAEQPDLHRDLVAAVGEGADALQGVLGGLRERVREAEKARDEVEAELNDLMSRLPNMADEQAPDGKSEADNVTVRTEGTPATFDGFTPQAHWDLAVPLGLEMETGAKLGGAGLYVMKGDLARLEWALISWFLDRAREAGYTQTMIPYVVGEDAMYATGYLPKMRDQIYHAAEDNLFLIPTAEAALTSLHANEMLAADDLPKAYTGFSPCWRREAGSWGAHVRGLLRLHQFHKVELFQLARPDDSPAVHQAMCDHIEGLLRDLGLHYRILELCVADLSFAAARCFDFEVWAPGAEQWLEVSSASNFHDFQARRAAIRYRDPETKKPVHAHTLNGSALATPRTLVAILETYQNADGSVTIPNVLRPYLAGLEAIAPASK